MERLGGIHVDPVEPAQDDDQLDVFLSYSRNDDEEFVGYLRAYLVERGIKVWRDRESMPSGGKPFTAEIEAAIRRAARLALVVGPEALRSPYVSKEWQFALREGLAVTPLVRGPYPSEGSTTFTDLVEDLPRRLRRLHAVDCRRSDHRPEHDALEEVARLLAQRLGRLGRLYNAGPALPPWYVWRNDLLEELIDAIVESDSIAVEGGGSAGMARPVAVQGMAGGGKTLLARAVARDGGVRRLFPDGVFWVEMGRTPAIATRQAEIGQSFGGRPEDFGDSVRGREQLETLLRDKSALLVLDDVWELEHARAFQVAASGCRLLVTTRWGHIARRLEAISKRPDVLKEDEALELLVGRLRMDGDAAEAGGDEQLRLVRLLGFHAQAIGLAAAWLREHGETSGRGYVDRTGEYLDRLERRRAEGMLFEDLNIEPDERNRNLEQSLAESYESLGSDGQRRFRALGGFAEGTLFARGAAAAVWAADEADAESHLNALVQAALVDRVEGQEYRQHMLLRQYARALLTRQADEHREVRARHHAYYLQRLSETGTKEPEVAQGLFALEVSEAKLPLVEALVPHLTTSPFVWSGVQHALVTALASVESGSDTSTEVWGLVERLVDSREGSANRLAVSALGEHGGHAREGKVVELLGAWLQPAGAVNGIRARSAAQVGVLSQHEPLLRLALTHRSESVRNIVVNDAYQLWRNDPELVERLLTFLTSHITFRQLLNWKNVAHIATAAVNLSGLVALRDYADRALAVSALGTVDENALGPSLTMVQKAWRPVIRECFMVNRAPLLGPLARQIRLRVVRVIASIIIHRVRAIDKRENFTFSFADVEEYCRTSKDHPEYRETVDRLLDFIEPNRSLEELTGYVYSLAERGVTEPGLNNWFIVNTVQMALLAHLHRDPIGTAHAMYDVVGRMRHLYPKTTDPHDPTCRLWYVVTAYPYLSFPFDKPPGERSVVEDILRRYMRLLLIREQRFRNRYRCATGRILRLCNLEAYLFCYQLGLPDLGRRIIRATLRFNIRNQDHEHIAWTPYSIAVGMKRYRAPAEGIRALDDLLTILNEFGYFDMLSDADLRKFWQKGSDDLVLYAGEYQQLFLDLLRRLRERDLQPRLRTALTEAENRISINLRDQGGGQDEDEPDTQIGEAMAWALRNALFGTRDNYLLKLLRSFYHELAVAGTPEDAVVNLIQQLVNGLYGERIF
jgi:hypothetical protein